jgi:hypothetical protein
MGERRKRTLVQFHRWSRQSRTFPTYAWLPQLFRILHLVSLLFALKICPNRNNIWRKMPNSYQQSFIRLVNSLNGRKKSRGLTLPPKTSSPIIKHPAVDTKPSGLRAMAVCWNVE